MSDELVAAVERAMDDRKVARVLEMIDAAVPIRATVIKTEKVKTADGNGVELPGKCRITFQAGNEDEPETIETEWLSDPIALRNARVAQAHKGQQVTLFKLNATDPEKKVAQGFRRVVWVEA